MNVFFLRGLSTEGSDDIKWGLFDQGPMDRELSRAFARRSVNLISVLGMGVGPWTEVAARARASLESHPIWQDEDQPVHLFGHSAGGVVLRYLLETGLQRRNLISAITLASPHQGAYLARVFATMPETHGGSTLLFRMLGYDVRQRSTIFSTLDSSIVNGLWRPDFAAQNLRVASVVASLPRGDWCHLLKLAHSIKALESFTQPSDGIVELETQPWGEVIAELKIDHVRQIGLFNDGKSFDQLCDVLCEFFKNSQAGS